MALIKPDFSEIADSITAGTYRVRVKKGEVKEWPNGGQYINWELETYGDEKAQNNGRKTYAKTSVSGKGAFMLQAMYRAATGKALTGEFDTEELVGKELSVTLVDGINRQSGEPTGYVEVKKFGPAQV